MNKLAIYLLLVLCATPAAADPLPLLKPGLTIGTTLYGSAELTALGMAERGLIEQAVAQGLNGFSYYIDWADLEPEPGRYTLETFTATLDQLNELGLAPFVNLTVGDSEGYNLPPEYGDGSGGLATGVALDDADVIARFGRLLDRVVPALVARRGFYLGVGNEADIYLDIAANVEQRAAYARFVAAARERVRAIEPRLAVGVTLTTTAVRARSATFRALGEVSDVIPVNYGPIDADFFVKPLDDIRSDFREVMAAFDGKPLIIQELSCPNASLMGATLSWQQGCYERLFDELRAFPTLRFVSVFTFQDFGPTMCSTVQDALIGDELNDLPEAVAQRLAQYFCALGIVSPDGQPKPAWQTLLDALGEVLLEDGFEPQPASGG